MHSNAFKALACPQDGGPLTQHQQTWRCAVGHSFDIARQGYIHLLPVNQKRSKDPGDSKAMVAARQRFLNAGHYQPIAEAINTAVLDFHSRPGQIRCLDAGCGEGYYLRQLETACDNQQLSLLGLDISKWAILSAARQQKNVTWVVGSNAHLPVLPGTLNTLLCVFGFPNIDEFSRVLEPGGLFLKVDPGPNHLQELRELIYPVIKSKTPTIHHTPEGFNSLESQSVKYSLTLSSQEQINNLLVMTPHFYRANVEGRERVSKMDTLTLTVEVFIQLFKKAG